MSAKVTQNYRLWTMLQSGEPVTIDAMQQLLGVSRVSVPVYIHELKKFFKAEIESIRDGTKVKVVAYRLLNQIKVPEYRRNNGQYVAKAPVTPATDEGAAPIIDKDNELTVMGDKEFADVAESLGVDVGVPEYHE